MRNLMKWLFFVVLFFSIWIPLVTQKFTHRILDRHSTLILYFPIIAVFTFGIYAASVVLWRVYTFNDCKEAAIELQNQILEAKSDLKRRGFQFDE